MAGRIQDSYETLEGKVEERTRELNESLGQQTATAEVLKVISRSAFDLRVVLDTLLGSAIKLCDADKGAIHQKAGAFYDYIAASGFSEEMLEWARANPLPSDGGNTTGRAATEGVAIQIADVRADPGRSELAREYSRRSNYQTSLAVPLRRGGEQIGVFTLCKQVARPFTEKQVELVQTFADQAVIAIENARLFDEVQARTHELSVALQQQTATADVLKVISRSVFELETVLNTLARSATELCNAGFGGIYLREGDVLRIRGMSNVDAEYVEFLRNTAIPVSDQNYSGRAVLFGEIGHVRDVQANTNPSFKGNSDALGYRTILHVPLMRDGVGIGFIALCRMHVEEFTPRQIELVTTFADQAVIAIANARLFEEVQARTRELDESLQQQTATANVLKVISRSAFDLEAVLSTLISSAGELCESTRGFIYLRQGDAFRARAAFGYLIADFEPLKALLQRPGRDNVAQRVAASGQVEHIPDALADPEYVYPIRVSTGSARAFLGVPLTRDGLTEGVFVLSRPEPRAFSDRDIELVQTFADQAVIAVENSRLFEQVQARTRELQQSLDDLKNAQDRLVQSEKLASLGQLTAGIAHEIKNPLNFVNNFSALSADLIDELNEVLAPLALDGKAREEVDELTGMLKGNLEKVVSHGKRADSIVKNMLLHSREGSGDHRPVDVNALVEESMNLAYHGARAEKPSFNVTLERRLDPAAGEVDLYPQEITRVLLNLIGNGFYATTKRKAEGGDLGFEPTLMAATRDLGDRVEIRIRDNGTGIPEEVKAKMFNPFFTTKPAGEGTGLGLSLSHDIVVKQHRGSIEVATEPGTFTEFTIVLPRDCASTPAKAGS